VEDTLRLWATTSQTFAPRSSLRQATWRRVWKLIKQEVAMMIAGVKQWNFARWEQCLAVMQERPRRRKLQTLPGRVNRLIAS
jgi:hypothetical protein